MRNEETAWDTKGPAFTFKMRGALDDKLRIALLSQEGSTIETAVEIVRGVVPESHSLRMHSETFRFGTTPRVVAKMR
jgi:hypothetical protein